MIDYTSIPLNVWLEVFGFILFLAIISSVSIKDNKDDDVKYDFSAWERN